jgi:hypothetical protein
VAVRLLLVDTSAYVRGAVEVTGDAELCVCAVTRLELLYSARSQEHCRLVEEDLAQFRDLRMDADVGFEITDPLPVPPVMWARPRTSASERSSSSTART